MSIKFKVWWIPQVPMKAFEVPVSSVEEGRKICEVLAEYDNFQFENNIKPDYCNVGGVLFHAAPISENDDDWIEVPDDEDEWNEYLTEISNFKEKEK